MSGWIGETLVASTVLMLAVLALRRPVHALFGPQVAYALWLVPALRMVLPPLPEAFVAATPVMPLPVHLQTALPLQRFAQLPHPASAPADWTVPLALVWLAGAFLCLVLSVWAYVVFLNRLRASGRSIGTIDGLTIWASAAVDGPLAFGVLRQGVAVPGDYATRYADGEFALALRHEAMHHHRRDLALNIIALTMRALHWFNPVAYWAHRAFRADQELACDAAVLAGEGEGARHAYACALVKSAGLRLPAAACAMNGKGQLKRRLVMMNRKINSRRRTLVGGAAIGVLVIGGLGLTASGGVAAAEVQHLPKKLVRAIASPVALSSVPPVAAGPGTVRLFQVAPEAPMPPSAPDAVPPAPPAAAQPPAVPERAEAPEAPEPPEAEAEAAKTIAEIDASVSASLAQAEASIAQARAQAAKCGAEQRRNGCADIDMAEIRRDVIDGLREAQRDLRDDDIPADVRARVMASLDRAILRVRDDPRWR